MATETSTPLTLDDLEKRLTPRMRQIVDAFCDGADGRDIAKSLKLTLSTVNTYAKRIYLKLGVHSRHELMAKVWKLRVARLEEIVRSPSPLRRDHTDQD
jgi:DNA-binding NarL/FixJ family response regulator